MQHIKAKKYFSAYRLGQLNFFSQKQRQIIFSKVFQPPPNNEIVAPAVGLHVSQDALWSPWQSVTSDIVSLLQHGISIFHFKGKLTERLNYRSSAFRGIHAWCLSKKLKLPLGILIDIKCRKAQTDHHLRIVGCWYCDYAGRGNGGSSSSFDILSKEEDEG